jgi:hypothetical protein
MRARDNPFRTDKVLQIRYRLQNTTWEKALEKLQNLCYRGSVVGREGVGKSTLLEDLIPRLSFLGFGVKKLRLFQGQTCLPPCVEKELWDTLSPKDIILLDSAEQMSYFAWRRFKKKSTTAGGLIITSHTRGMLPTWIECRTSPELFYSIVQDLIGQGEAISLKETIWELFARHQGNIREGIRSLYDLYADGGSSKIKL